MGEYGNAVIRHAYETHMRNSSSCLPATFGDTSKFPPPQSGKSFYLFYIRRKIAKEILSN